MAQRTGAPLATYRFQLSAEFNFDRAAALADYLADLGITHLYVSPCLQAVRGSMHGYDLVDPARVSDALGGPEGFLRLRGALAKRGLGLVVDIVPNHQAAEASQNPLWRDVLENGRASRWADFFDIDWDRPEPDLRGKVLLPILGAPLEECFAAGAIRVQFAAGRFTLLCEGQDLPLAPQSVPQSAGGEGGAQAAAGISADQAALAKLLDAQHYRLACWRDARTRINYRRFFNIAGLVGVCVEREEVFRHTHARVLEWVRDGLVDGLRVDHIDGLRDPPQYLRRLREACPRQWIVAEKILGPQEELPEDWPVDGTTGYDFLNQVGGLFVDPSGEAPMTEIYGRFTGEPLDYGAIVRRKKLDVLERFFAGELERLTGVLEEVWRQASQHCDVPRAQLREALAEVIAALPVYRTYLAPGRAASAQETAHVEAAVSAARRARPDLDESLWEFLRGAALLRGSGDAAANFVAMFQQLTGPVAAKGVEDTAFYCFNRLVSLNEVGGDPARFGMPVEEFHRLCGERQRRWPRTMLAASTHDTKRSLDVRSRISVLSEIPREWEAAVRRWSALNEPRRRGDAPSRNDEYFFYQTLVGAWPISEERLAACMRKSVREASLRTSWLDPDPAYEEALRRFVAGALDDQRFVTDLEAFLATLQTAAWTNSLAQTLIQCTAPGVPDFYQGSELWDLSLADPDNRRPVDYELRRKLLAELPRGDGAVRGEGVFRGEGVSPLRAEGILPSVVTSSAAAAAAASAASVFCVSSSDAFRGERRTRETEEETRGRDAHETQGQDALATHGRDARGTHGRDGHATEEGLPKLLVIHRALALRRRRPELFGPRAEYRPLWAQGAKAEHVVAFARGEGAVTVVPRLTLRLGGAWADTVLPLPGGEWVDVFSGRAFGGETPLAVLLSEFPVALLSKKET
jgi:(1->4)-alpha-D-glucan 1-alpha-D-glucosylmutase